MRRKKERISTPDGKGGRASREKWLVSIEPVPSWAQTYLAMASSTLAIDAPRVDMLTGEIMDDDDEGEQDGVIEGIATVVTERQADPPGFAVWCDWVNANHAKAWAMTQGKFNVQAHMENAYAKVKAEAKPETPQAMWQAWYEYVTAHEMAKAQPVTEPATDDPDGWREIDANGVTTEKAPF